jgi:hypothetical protein
MDPNQLFDGDRMDNMYSISIEYSPAYELVISFYAYVHHKNLKSIRLDETWLKDVSRKPRDSANLANS